jgi:lipid-binding SYLF domain-containing protein
MRFLKITLTGLLIVAATAGISPALAENYTSTIELYRRSPEAQKYFAEAYGYAVFPTIAKGGVGIGGAFGEGKVYREGKITGDVSMIKLSAGLQLGVQAFSEIIFFKDKDAYERFTAGAFEFDATASAVIITVGGQAQVGTGGNTAGVALGPATAKYGDVRYTRGMAVFIKAIGGLMYEAAIGGQKFIFKAVE